MTRRTHAALVALVVPFALLLSACGGSTKSTAPTPTPTPTHTPSVEVPSGVTLTTPGTTLALGHTATVPYRPNDKRGSVLALTVTKITKASLRDFSAYTLDQRTRASTPYYVDVKVENVGRGDLGGTDVPLWAVDQANTLIHSSSFTNDFTKCPSRSLPADFAPSAKQRTCLVYLVPNHGHLTAVSFRPLQSFAPILWKGAIVKPHHAHKNAHKHAHKKKSKH